MRVLIVFESLFGTTHTTADAIAAGIREARPDTEVACLRVTEAGSDLVESADLLVVGGPAHVRGMTSAFSRKMGLKGEVREPEVGTSFTRSLGRRRLRPVGGARELPHRPDRGAAATRRGRSSEVLGRSLGAAPSVLTEIE